MAELILGALIFAFGLITFTPLNRVSFVILAFGFTVALHGAARVAAALVMRGIKEEADRRDALPVRAPVANLSSTNNHSSITTETLSSTNNLPSKATETPSSTIVSPTEPERLN